MTRAKLSYIWQEVIFIAIMVGISGFVIGMAGFLIVPEDEKIQAVGSRLLIIFGAVILAQTVIDLGKGIWEKFR